jgi:hypothetical protein
MTEFQTVGTPAPNTRQLDLPAATLTTRTSFGMPGHDPCSLNPRGTRCVADMRLTLATKDHGVPLTTDGPNSGDSVTIDVYRRA